MHTQIVSQITLENEINIVPPIIQSVGLSSIQTTTFINKRTTDTIKERYSRQVPPDNEVNPGTQTLQIRQNHMKNVS